MCITENDSSYTLAGTRLGFFRRTGAETWVQDAEIGTGASIAALILAAASDTITQFADWAVWFDASDNCHAAVVGYQDLGGGTNANAVIYHLVNTSWDTDRTAFVMHGTPVLVDVGTKDAVWDCGGRVSHPHFCRGQDGLLYMAHTGRPTALPSTFRYETGFATVNETTFALTYLATPPHFRCNGQYQVEAAECRMFQSADGTWNVVGKRQGASSTTIKVHLRGATLTALREVAKVVLRSEVPWADASALVDGVGGTYLDDNNWVEYFQSNNTSALGCIGQIMKGNPYA